MKKKTAATGRRRWVSLAACALACWLLAGMSFEAASIEVKVQRDETFSFAGLKTWAWHTDGPGEVKVAFAADTDPKPINANLHPVILAAVEREFAKRKITKAEAGAQPSLIVRYYMLVTASTSTQTMGQFLPATAQWGLPPFGAQTTSMEVVPVGTFVLDALVPGRDGLVWRGGVQAKASLDNTAQENAKVLDKAITDLFKKFPTK